MWKTAGGMWSEATTAAPQRPQQPRFPILLALLEIVSFFPINHAPQGVQLLPLSRLSGEIKKAEKEIKPFSADSVVAFKNYFYSGYSYQCKEYQKKKKCTFLFQLAIASTKNVVFLIKEKKRKSHSF